MNQMTLALFDVGGQEMLLILVVILILFGAKKLPEMARNLGRSVEQFKRAANHVRDEVVNADLREQLNEPAKLLTGTEPSSYEEAHASTDHEYPNPTDHVDVPVESKTEVTLNVSATPPEGAVSQGESNDQVPPQQA